MRKVRLPETSRACELMEKSKVIARRAVESAAMRACMTGCAYKKPDSCPICIMLSELGYDDPCQWLDDAIDRMLKEFNHERGH